MKCGGFKTAEGGGDGTLQTQDMKRLGDCRTTATDLFKEKDRGRRRVVSSCDKWA
jgi:hypothetical protein